MRFLSVITLALLSALSAPPALKLAPCRLPDFANEVRCGTYEVFENRAARSGRRIGLRVVVIPAHGKPVSPDPIVFFAGGPGGSPIEMAPLLADKWAAALLHRDLLLIDPRGVGGSHPLACPPPDGTGGGEAPSEGFLDPAAVRRCRDSLAKDNDFTQYTTDATVDDADEVRAALGYHKVNLTAASYGTRLALDYLRRHPGSVRTLRLTSVVPPDGRTLTLLAPNAQAAFDHVVAACAAEAPCHAAFPDPRADLDAVLKRLSAAPEMVSIRDREGKERNVRISHDDAVEAVRFLLMGPSGVRELPLLLHRAAAGDLGPFGRWADETQRISLAGPPDGHWLSVSCAETIPVLDRAEAERLARGTFVGDLRLRLQLAACAEWPAARIAPGFFEPVRSTVPVLIFAGENDPATPLAGAQHVARTLPHSRILIVPGGGHTFTGLPGAECLDQLTADFIARGSAEGLDLESCRKAIRRLPFATSPASPGL
ncbi:MAG TPA: alpha/beta hydrolase [Thermoanaerobaculia bacterium]|jgi:pimeloyl-ACP methyl ester carboxylesterase|nr:alpha/beta hydrolase [Thermoanaerobaculia bacterium]